MTQAEIEAAAILDQATVLKASNAPLGARLLVANQALALSSGSGDQLEQWEKDQLDAIPDYLEVGTQAGTAAKPNAYTTSAAKTQDASVGNQIWGKGAGKFIEDLRAGLAPAFEGITKGLGSTIVKAAAILGGVWLVLHYIDKRSNK